MNEKIPVCPAMHSHKFFFLVHPDYIDRFNHKKFKFYSQLKKRIARMVQSAVTHTITQSGSRMLPVPIPKNVFFIIVSPCVSGKTLTIFCIAFGITSIGSVVPEKTSMGKYRIEAMTLACLVFFATPPASIPTDRVEIMVIAQLPRKATSEPCNRTPHKRAAADSVTRDTAQ